MVNFAQKKKPPAISDLSREKYRSAIVTGEKRGYNGEKRLLPPHIRQEDAYEPQTIAGMDQYPV